ncbi:MAG: TauD/TfdA family dioxygenase [Nocardioidaceae bacterium]
MTPWHTEDAFHPYRADWVVLACLRNPDSAATTIGCVDDVRLSRTDLKVLFEPRFIISPDNSHRLANNTAKGEADFGRVEQMVQDPPPVPLLSGDPADPYITADVFFWDVYDSDDEEAAGALNHLTEQVDRCLQDVVLEPGDFCFIDNFKAVHGRKPFAARYDGRDRWLKRVCITRDLRKSRDARHDSLSRIMQ